MSQVRELLIAAFLLVMSIMLTVFACTLIENANAWPLLALMFYLFAPVPLFICKTNRSQDLLSGGGSGGDTFTNVGHFLTGMIGASGPCMSLVQFHTGAISVGGLFLSLGSAVMLIAAVAVLTLSQKKDDSGF